MPNWNQGDLKVRGTTENIQRFMKERILNGQTVMWPGYAILDIPRCFVPRNSLEDAQDLLDDYESNSPEPIVVVFNDTKIAWGFAIDHVQKAFESISARYHIDFKITSWESGMEFKTEFECVNGKVTRCDEIQYENWVWEAERPSIGG
ncbi:MAG: hypothetical protein SOH70_03955 [Lentilactobacillus sunkii]|jgi:hypothetical protein|uniref:hypothetical protein n=1 Tax=Lentilactobacillus sunkii TaxID=481719 RepID=UPI002F357534